MAAKMVGEYIKKYTQKPLAIFIKLLYYSQRNSFGGEIN
jgi:hypothetical protein